MVETIQARTDQKVKVVALTDWENKEGTRVTLGAAITEDGFWVNTWDQDIRVRATGRQAFSTVMKGSEGSHFKKRGGVRFEVFPGQLLRLVTVDPETKIFVENVRDVYGPAKLGDIIGVREVE